MGCPANCPAVCPLDRPGGCPGAHPKVAGGLSLVIPNASDYALMPRIETPSIEIRQQLGVYPISGGAIVCDFWVK